MARETKLVKLQKYLDDRDITQKEFAEKIGVSQATVCDWLGGITTPRGDNLRALMHETKLPLKDLVFLPTSEVV